MWFAWRLIRKPFEWYYHWQDPLLTEGTDGVSVKRGTDEEIRERLRYKTKVKDWSVE